MLFEIMERNVWSKAANDSVGLQKFYKEHQATYKWDESATVLLFNCSDSNARGALRAPDSVVADRFAGCDVAHGDHLRRERHCRQ